MSERASYQINELFLDKSKQLHPDLQLQEQMAGPCAVSPRLAQARKGTSKRKRQVRAGKCCGQSTRVLTLRAQVSAGSNAPDERFGGGSSASNGKPARTDLTKLESAAASVPGNLKLAAGAALVAAATGVGVLVGDVAPRRVRNVARTATGAVAAAGGAYGATRAESARKRAVAKTLRNTFADGVLSPDAVTRDELELFQQQYNVPSLGSECPSELAAVYDSYLSSVLPSGDAQLEGWEPGALRQLKDALQLQDSDAAQVHIDVGRRIFRQKQEQGDRSGEVSARRQMNSLIYLSTLVFGEVKSRFLLPWQRLFDLTEGQVNVAIREGASGVFKHTLEQNEDALGAEHAEPLYNLREQQKQLLLSDDTASQLIQKALTERVEKVVQDSADAFKASARKDPTDALGYLENAIAYNRRLRYLVEQQQQQEEDEQQKQQEDSSMPELPPGFGPVSLMGSQLEKSREQELRSLFRMFYAENIKAGNITSAISKDVDELRQILGIGKQEADKITHEVKMRAYRNTIRRALSDGTLESAASPAKWLEDACSSLTVPPEQAAEVHRELYMSMLNEALEDKRIDEDEERELEKIRRLLCLDEQMVRDAKKETCGGLYRRAVEDAIAAGTDGFNPTLRRQVRQAQLDLRLDDDIAVSVISDVAQRAFMTFVREARSKPSKVENAKELRKMTFFNSSVITPLINDIRGEKEQQSKDSQAEIDNIMEEAKEAAKKEEQEEVSSQSSSEASSADQQAEQMKQQLKQQQEQQEQKKWQSEVSLRDQLSERDRAELYKNYLIFCMTGDQVDAPLGQVITVERDQAEFTRLQEVGDIVGLNQIEVMQVQKDLAEEAFKANAEQVLADGKLTDERKQQLDSLQKQLNLPDESAQKIISNITNKRIANEMQQRSGSMTLQDMLDMKEQGIDIEAVASKEQRLKLLRQEVEAALADGSGQFDPSRYGQKLPQQLGVDEQSASKAMREAADQKRRTTLVQAVSAHRQKKNDVALQSLNNLASCQLASGGYDPVQWNNSQELEDLYCLFATTDAPEYTEDALLHALGLTNERASQLKQQAVYAGVSDNGSDSGSSSSTFGEESLY